VSQPPVTVSHFAACVRDLQRSRRFYEALGFEVALQVDVTAPFEKLTELPVLQGKAIFFTHPTMAGRFEILEYSEPGYVGPAERRPMNQLGLTHMSLVTEDIEALCKTIDANGGEAHRHTRLSGPYGEMMFASDPDGMRLELWQKPPEA
jgi:lactoylglutathione lyase